MQIPVYLAVKGEEIKNFPIAQLGFGFYPNGSVRLPQRILPNAIAVVDDLYLPNFNQSAIKMLRSKIPNGCILDFERPQTQQHRKLIESLPKIIAIASAFHSFAPKSLPIISCSEPCNSWGQFSIDAHKRYPKGWMLELVPWRRTVAGKAQKKEGFLQNAICRYRQTENELLYFDTKQTIAQKLTIAQTYGCRGAIGILEELRSLE